MNDGEVFNDPVLGDVTWNADRGAWLFAVTLPEGGAFRGSITPEDSRLPLADQGLAEIRRCVAWIRDNEPSIRAHIADQMFEGWREGWYDEDIDEVTTKEGFQETIELEGINILEDRVATLCYNDGNLFGGHAIVLDVSGEGQFVDKPNIWG